MDIWFLLLFSSCCFFKINMFSISLNRYQLWYDSEIYHRLCYTPWGKWCKICSLLFQCAWRDLRFSGGINVLIINYVFQTAAWSCSWDLNCSHYVYAGLQVLNSDLFSFMKQSNLMPFLFLSFFPCFVNSDYLL